MLRGGHSTAGIWSGALIITCPKCKTRYQMKDDTTAAKVRCKKCQTVIDVKASTAGGEADRSAMKTVAPDRSQAATVVPAAEKPGADADRSEMKTVAPGAGAAADRSQGGSSRQYGGRHGTYGWGSNTHERQLHPRHMSSE